MRVLQILVLIIGLTIFANSQTSDKSILSGIIYDANGAVIVGVAVGATDESGKKFDAVTNNEGIYILNLPFNTYNYKADFRIAKYSIIVKGSNFETLIYKDFRFVPSYKGTMNLDIALDVQTFVDTIIINPNKNNKRKQNK